MQDADIEAPERSAARDEPAEGFFDKTWELELLISGGVVFALLQFPPLLEQTFFRLEPRFLGWWKDAFVLAFAYLKGILYALIAAFVLHLSSRAYWIGLLGLEKVHPEGIRWDNLKSGPITRRIQRELIPPIRQQIVRLDRFCSSIFAFAFLVVVGCLISILLVGLCVLLTWGLSLVLGERKVSEIFTGILFAISLVLALPGILDKLLAGRLKPGGRMERALERILRAFQWLQLGHLFGGLMLVLVSSRRRSLSVLVTLFFGCMLAFGLVPMLQRDTLWRNDSPAPQREIIPLYYEDQWPEEGFSRLAPSIQSDVIEEPYVKLFIPYLPSRHDEVFAQRCPNPQDKLACAALLHRVAVDGRAVPDLTFLFYTHPKLGARGFLAYIPTAGLASGPHLLRIEPLPLRKRKWLRRKDPQPYFIRFWT